MQFVVASPPGVPVRRDDLARLRREMPELELNVTDDPAAAVRDAAAIYTDVWTSMGQEAERPNAASDFAAYQVNAELMAPRPATPTSCTACRPIAAKK